jgi:hypothetical protein
VAKEGRVESFLVDQLLHVAESEVFMFLVVQSILDGSSEGPRSRPDGNSERTTPVARYLRQ